MMFAAELSVGVSVNKMTMFGLDFEQYLLADTWFIMSKVKTVTAVADLVLDLLLMHS